MLWKFLKIILMFFIVIWLIPFIIGGILMVFGLVGGRSWEGRIEGLFWLALFSVVLYFSLKALAFCQKKIKIEKKKRKKLISDNLEDIMPVNTIDGISKPIDIGSNYEDKDDAPSLKLSGETTADSVTKPEVDVNPEKCPHCGNEIQIGALFCENCGVKIR